MSEQERKDKGIIERLNKEINREEKIVKIKNNIKVSIVNLKQRIFKPNTIKIGMLIGTTSLVFGSALYIKTNEDTLDMKKNINNLEREVGVHGGVKDINDDEYIYNLTQHVESGKCQIKGEDISIEDRIINYCKENNIPKYIEVSAIEKFHYYMSNDYESGNQIDLISIYHKYCNDPDSSYIKLNNGDIITIDGDNATYTYSQNNSNGLYR